MIIFHVSNNAKIHKKNDDQPFLALNLGRHILYVALRLTYFFNAIFHSDSFGNFQRTVRRNVSK